jgi:hypothetical protein
MGYIAELLEADGKLQPVQLKMEMLIYGTS